MPMFGITPPKEIFEDLPEGVSIQIAAETWFSAYHDGHEGKEYHVFGKDQAHLQPIYSNGYDQGERGKAAREALGARPGVQSSESEKAVSGREVAVIPGEPTEIEEGVILMIEGQQTKTYQGITWNGAEDRVAKAMSLGLLKNAVLTPAACKHTDGSPYWNLSILFDGFDHEEENDDRA